MQLTLKDKLDFLWQDFVSFINQATKEGKYIEGFSDNFKEITEEDVLSFKSGKMPRMRSTEELFNGKVVLTLHDVAVLLDAGLDDFIEGNYSGFVSLLSKYIEDQDATVFNQVNVAMFEMSGSCYMPYLSEKGKRMFREKIEEYQKIIPVSVSCSPYFYDFVNKQISWEDNSKFTGEIPAKNDIIRKVISSENERLKDIALLMSNIENLKILGFDRFL